MTTNTQVTPALGGSLFSVLLDRTYRHLFLAQIVALEGTGLATVALGLLAFDLAGSDASDLGAHLRAAECLGGI